MFGRDGQKLQRAKRRLAAVAFLTNISLDGSYRDTGWGLELSQQEAKLCSAEGTTDASVHYNDEGPPDLGQGNEIRGYCLDVPQLDNSKHVRTGSLGGGGVLDYDYFSRKRANTSGSDLGLIARARRHLVHQEGDLSQSHYPLLNQKHAHFSSNESVEMSRGRHSSTNIYDSQTVFPHHSRAAEIKFVNMRELPPPVIRDERLVILVSKRTPVLVYSSLPYTRSMGRLNRTVERVENIRRTRNPSGSRPMSSLSDPDPLEQLVHDSEDEVSYGYLLQPSVSHRQRSVESNNTEGPLDNHFKHSLVTRCVSYDGSMKTHVFNPLSGTTEMLEGDGGHVQSRGSTLQSTSTASGPINTTVYSPMLLDDPEFRAGKHRTVLTFPSYITSVIDYCKPSDMKKELNDKFKDRFPHIDLSLSKLRSIKREMRKVAKTECNLDFLTVAQSYVYFEKLILRSYVTKFNRKFCAGACLLLAAKLNDIKGDILRSLIEKIETTFRVNRRDLLAFEFAVLVALEFALHLPNSEVFPHYQRLIYES